MPGGALLHGFAETSRLSEARSSHRLAKMFMVNRTGPAGDRRLSNSDPDGIDMKNAAIRIHDSSERSLVSRRREWLVTTSV